MNFFFRPRREGTPGRRKRSASLSASTKPSQFPRRKVLPVDVSVRSRSVRRRSSFAKPPRNDFERAALGRLDWEAFSGRPPRPGCANSDPRLLRAGPARVFRAERKAHIAGPGRIRMLRASDAASDLSRMLNHMEIW